MNMGKLATLGVNFAGCWGFVVTAGFMVNALCTKDFRLGIAAKILRKPLDGYFAKGDLKEVSGLFIRNTLFRVFRNNPFSIRSFIRSLALSIVFQIVLLFLIVHLNGFDILQDNLLAPLFDQSGVFVFMCFLSLIMLDYLSFMQTVYFMSYASNASLLNVIFTAYADLFLSINIFLLVVPVFVASYLLGHADIRHATAALVFSTTAPERVSGNTWWRTTEHVGSLSYLNTSFVNRQNQEIHGNPNREGLGAVIGNSIQAISVFEYEGMSFSEIPDYIQAAYPALFYNSVLPDKGIYTPAVANFANGTLITNIEIKALSPLTYLNMSSSNPIRVLWSLYGVGYRIGQILVASMPEDLFPLIQKDVTVNDEQGAISNIMQVIYGNYDASRQFAVLCDGNIEFGPAPELLREKKCSRRLIMTNPAPAVISMSAILSNSTMIFPVGVFFLSSVFYTILFYLVLLMFLAVFLALRLIIIIFPDRLSHVLDIESIRENSVWIILTLGGMPISAALAIASLQP